MNKQKEPVSTEKVQEQEPKIPEQEPNKALGKDFNIAEESDIALKMYNKAFDNLYTIYDLHNSVEWKELESLVKDNTTLAKVIWEIQMQQIYTAFINVNCSLRAYKTINEKKFMELNTIIQKEEKLQELATEFNKIMIQQNEAQADETKQKSEDETKKDEERKEAITKECKEINKDFDVLVFCSLFHNICIVVNNFLTFERDTKPTLQPQLQALVEELRGKSNGSIVDTIQNDDKKTDK